MENPAEVLAPLIQFGQPDQETSLGADAELKVEFEVRAFILLIEIVRAFEE